MADLRVPTAPDPVVRLALDAVPARADRAEVAGEVLPEAPSCRTPMSEPGEAAWRRRLRVARSWWCAFVSGLG